MAWTRRCIGPTSTSRQARIVFSWNRHSPWRKCGEARKRVKGPLLANMVEGGKTPWLTVQELQDLGYDIVIYPLSGWMGAAVVVREIMKELKETGTTQGFWKKKDMRMSFEELFGILDYPKVSELERKYVVK